MVMLYETASAMSGMVQLPLVPRTVRGTTSPLRSGVLRSPTRVSGRVSSRRHDVIGTNTDPGELSACAYHAPPPAPTATASAAPMAAQRDRLSDVSMGTPRGRPPGR